MPDLCIVWKVGQLSLRYLALLLRVFLFAPNLFVPVSLWLGCRKAVQEGCGQGLGACWGKGV